MANDHYVAQTYLRRFSGPSGMLRAYRKSDGKSFPCSPRDVCHEWNGDIIPDFLSDPNYLGDYRAEFERIWNVGIEALEAKSLNADDKLCIAGYWAQLLVCTPTWTRMGVETTNQRTVHAVSAYHSISVSRGKAKESLGKAIEDLEAGKILVETEPDYVRAQYARNVLNYAWALYNAEWDVFENDTGTDYFTSDNPASFMDQGDNWGPPGKVPFVRLLPVTPKLCLACDLTKNPKELMSMEPDFSRQPWKTIRGGKVSLKTVEHINACTAKCAEDLVLCSAESTYVGDVTARYAKFKVTAESMRFPTSDGFLVANRTRCVETAH